MTDAAAFFAAGARRRRAGGGFALRFARLRFTARRRADFYTEFAFVLRRGAAEFAALERLLEMERDLPGGPFGRPLTVLIPEWMRAIRAGEGLSSGIAASVSAHEATAFRAWAGIGVAPARLRGLADDVERLAALRGRLLGGLWPLAFAVAVAWGGFAAAHWYMFPLMEEAMGGARWEGLAGWVRGVAGGIAVQGGAGLVLAAVLGPFLARLAARRWTGRLRALADGGMPGFAMYRRATGMSWLVAMAALLDAGATPAGALEVLRRDASPYLRERLDAALARSDLLLGDALLASGLGWPDIRVVHRIRLCLEGDDPASEFRALAGFEMGRLERDLRRVAEAAAMAGYLALAGFILLVVFVQNDLARAF